MGILGGRVGAGTGSPGSYQGDDQGELIVSVMFSCTINQLAQVSTRG